MQSAERVADVVRPLESSNLLSDATYRECLSAPPLAVSLDRGPIARSDEFREMSARAALFATMLRRFLGNERPVEAAIVDDMPSSPAQMRGPMGGAKAGRAADWPDAAYGAQPTFSFVSRCACIMGTLVTFSASPRRPSWPYRLLLSLVVLLAAVVVLSLVAVRVAM